MRLSFQICQPKMLFFKLARYVFDFCNFADFSFSFADLSSEYDIYIYNVYDTNA